MWSLNPDNLLRLHIWFLSSLRSVEVVHQTNGHEAAAPLHARAVVTISSVDAASQ